MRRGPDRASEPPHLVPGHLALSMILQDTKDSVRIGRASTRHFRQITKIG
jgi:hypothetical protein